MNAYSKFGQFMLTALAFVYLSAAGGSVATAFENTKAETVLRVTGKIAQTNAADGADFDLEMLEKLGATRFTTMTPWFDKPITFEGVLVRKVLAAVGAQGRQIVAVGLNDYRSTLPVEDFEKYDVILAYKRDGSYMKIRDKGPLFIVYPFDSDVRLQRQMYYGRSVWQLAQIVVF